MCTTILKFTVLKSVCNICGKTFQSDLFLVVHVQKDYKNTEEAHEKGISTLDNK